MREFIIIFWFLRSNNFISVFIKLVKVFGGRKMSLFKCPYCGKWGFFLFFPRGHNDCLNKQLSEGFIIWDDWK